LKKTKREEADEKQNYSCLERLIISPKADAGDILEPNRETTARKGGKHMVKPTSHQLKSNRST
jgi:hypothetical protein